MSVFDARAARSASTYTDAFVDAGIAKLDAAFGSGYAKANPTALTGYLAVCATNLAVATTPVQAAAAASDAMMDEAMSATQDLLKDVIAPAAAEENEEKER